MLLQNDRVYLTAWKIKWLRSLNSLFSTDHRRVFGNLNTEIQLCLGTAWLLLHITGTSGEKQLEHKQLQCLCLLIWIVSLSPRDPSQSAASIEWPAFYNLVLNCIIIQIIQQHHVFAGLLTEQACVNGLTCCVQVSQILVQCHNQIPKPCPKAVRELMHDSGFDDLVKNLSLSQWETLLYSADVCGGQSHMQSTINLNMIFLVEMLGLLAFTKSQNKTIKNMYHRATRGNTVQLILP